MNAIHIVFELDSGLYLLSMYQIIWEGDTTLIDFTSIKIL